MSLNVSAPPATEGRCESVLFTALYSHPPVIEEHFAKSADKAFYMINKCGCVFSPQPNTP